MIFNNSGLTPPSPPQMNHLGGGLYSFGKNPVSIAPNKTAPLNAPMIDRVYKAKPGCSACGKKVA